MKRKSIWLAFIAATATIAFAQGSGSSVLNAFVKTVNDAPAMSVDYTTQLIGGSQTEFKIDLAKPNKARIESPTQLIVADGSNITTFDKATNSFFKEPQSQAALIELFKKDDLSVWAAFFNAKAFEKVASVKLNGEKNLGGMKLRVVEIAKDAQGRIAQTLFIDDKNIVRRAQQDIKDPNGNATTLLIAKNIAIGAGSVNDSDFQFSAPAGSKEVSMEEMTAANWFYDLEEAKRVAKKTNRKIFVDFMASWCGPCKKLDAEVLQTDGFKAYAKYFVFLKIDVDEQPNVAKAYSITAMPTQMILDADGGILDKTVGYGSPAPFYAFIDKNK